MKKLYSATLEALDAKEVEVETTFTKGLPAFSIVGLASSAIQEAKERVKSALLMNDYKFPPLRITVNLSPSDINKNGTHFDLPIALSIALQDEEVSFEEFAIFGELGLDGKLKDSSNIFALVLSLLKQNKIKKVFVPKESADRLSVIPDIEIYSVSNLKEAIDFFRFKENQVNYQKKELEYNFFEIDNNKYYYNTDYLQDFIDIKGQEVAKRAAIISACGFHNILLEGSPGCGKSMIAKRLPYVTPPMSLEEILEKAKLELLDGVDATFEPVRSFRSPHHSSTISSIFGGGSKSAKIGEVALANNGILFFDELPHYSKKTLEALREPLEDNIIMISRVNSKVKYPTKFLFVAAQNPCPCGNLLSKTKECRCNELEIKRYKNILSEPFLDRIDMFVQMQEVGSSDKPTLSSKDIYEDVKRVFFMQKRRKQKDFNGKMSEQDISKYCILDSEAQGILDSAIDRFSLSFRSINKVLKVSRTIADLKESDIIKKEHILESLSYRRR
jgi:magnesium chelatase family protein